MADKGASKKAPRGAPKKGISRPGPKRLGEGSGSTTNSTGPKTAPVPKKR